MWLLDLVVGFFDDCCSLLGLIVDADSYLLLSRKWCRPWEEDVAEADSMMLAMTEAFVVELIAFCPNFLDGCFCCLPGVRATVVVFCRLVVR